MPPDPSSASKAPAAGDYAGLSSRQLVSRFFKYSLSYGSLNLLTKLGGFFLFPVFWKFLTPEDYGIIGLATVVQMVAVAFMTLGLESGLGRFYHEWKPEERPGKAGVLWLAATSFGLAITLAFDLLGSRFSGLLIQQVDFHPYLRIALWSAFFSSLATFPYIILRITENIRFYGIISLLTFLTNTAASLYMVAVLKWGSLGFLLSYLLNFAFWGLFWCAWIFRRIRLTWNWRLVRQELRYSLPALPINLSMQLDGALDRFFIDKFVPLSQIGIYSLGKRFGEYYNTLNQSLKTAWVPMIFKMMVQRPDFKEILPKLSLVYTFFVSIGALSLAMLSEEIIYLFGREKFMGVYEFVPWFVLAFFFKNFATAWGRGMDLAKKPHLELYAIFAGTASNVLLLALLVPRHGLYGAVAAFIVSSFLANGIQVALAHLAFPRHFPFLKIIFFLALQVGTFWLGTFSHFGSALFSLLVKCGLIGLYVLLGGLWLRKNYRYIKA